MTNKPKTEPKPDSAATSGRVQRLVLPCCLSVDPSAAEEVQSTLNKENQITENLRVRLEKIIKRALKISQ